MLFALSLYKQKLLTIVSFIFLISFISCDKKDKEKPVVIIEQPTGGSYSVTDSIDVVAKISDNDGIKLLSVYLIDLDNQRVSPAYTSDLSTKSYHLKIKYPIDNIYLESNLYYLVVEARDDYNTTKQYVSVQIGALTKYLKDVLIVESENNKTSLYSIGGGHKTLLKTIGEVYQDVIYNPYSKYYMFLTPDGVLKAFDENTFEEVWIKDGLKNPIRTYYGQLLYKDKLTYVSTGQNELRGYNNEGAVSKQANAIDELGQISHYVFNEDKLMMIKTPYTMGEDRIERLNAVTGASLWTYQMQFSPQRILFVNEDLCFVLGNKNNVAKACSLSTLYNVIHPIDGLGNRTFNDAYKYSTYLYLLSLDDKIIEYHLADGDERELDVTSGAVRFYYEELSDKLYYVDENKVAYLRYPSDGHILVYENDKPIEDLIFVYNK